MIWLTITSSVSGVFGFVVSILGGALLNTLQKMNLIFFGIQIYAQQVLSLLGFLILLFTFFYIKYFIETEKVDINRKDGRA